jgi:ADP-heptose:LPS heptosyltransferase
VERKEKWEQVLKIDPTQEKSPRVIFTPNTHDLLRVRKWNIENYIELSKRLIKQFPGITFVLTGLSEEKEELEQFGKEVGENYFINLAGDTDFEDLLTLYTLCDVLVTNYRVPPILQRLLILIYVVLFGPETTCLVLTDWRTCAYFVCQSCM